MAFIPALTTLQRAARPLAPLVARLPVQARHVAPASSRLVPNRTAAWLTGVSAAALASASLPGEPAPGGAPDAFLRRGSTCRCSPARPSRGWAICCAGRCRRGSADWRGRSSCGASSVRRRSPSASAAQLRAAAAESAMMIPAAARLRRHYPDLRIPALVLAGEGDRHVKAAQSARLAHELREAELRIAPGAGHMLLHYAPRGRGRSARSHRCDSRRAARRDRRAGQGVERICTADRSPSRQRRARIARAFARTIVRGDPPPGFRARLCRSPAPGRSSASATDRDRRGPGRGCARSRCPGRACRAPPT